MCLLEDSSGTALFRACILDEVIVEEDSISKKLAWVLGSECVVIHRKDLGASNIG